jgi:selenide,water dikinase
VLSELLKRSAPAAPLAPLLVGTETGDDAAVYRINSEQAIIATTDFFMPIVDDPFDFGRIAATNALSDIYAMGGTPLFALAIVGMPIKVLQPEVIREILRGGEEVCAQARIAIAGGHSIDSVEPIYGLAAIGIAHPEQVMRNSSGRAGDVLVLGKPLGVGILSAALKKEQLDAQGYRAMIELTTALNTPGPALARISGVHAMTDVTGFGLLGHLLGMCRGAGLSASLSMASIPLIENVLAMAQAGLITGASARNWAAYGEEVQLTAGITSAQQAVLCDPQTAGGLLVACSEDAVTEVLATFEDHGFTRAGRIGSLITGKPRVLVEL